MVDFSLVDKLKILMNLIISSHLFLFVSIFALIIFIYLITIVIFNKRLNKYIFISIWCIIGLIIIISYNKIFIELFDNLFDSIFKALYFPNVAIYIVLLIISNCFFIYSLFTKKIIKAYKIVNISSALIIDIILIMIMDLVNTNNINIYDEVAVFSNSNLLVLLQLSTAIFTSWILLNLFISAKLKLKKFDKVEIKPMPEIIFD